MAKQKINIQWDRVQRTSPNAEEVRRRDANRSILTNDVFLQACKEAKVSPTTRQARKWNNGKGAALPWKINAVMTLKNKRQAEPR